jgi:hypothetical protein
MRLAAGGEQVNKVKILPVVGKVLKTPIRE